MPDGYTKFRFEIQEVAPEGENQTPQWTCREVIITGAVTSQKITELVMKEKYGGGYEQKLINEYNEYVLGLALETAKTAYEAFLAERKALKLEIREAIAVS